VIREIFGKGSLFAGSALEMKMIGPTAEYWIDTTQSAMFGWYAPNNLMVLSPAALLLIGIMIWVQRGRNTKLIDIS
jgi:Na+-transporting NADH:ubiquinone oxidoreductase subunit D